MASPSYSYANGRLDLWTNLQFTDELALADVEGLVISTITFPFFYWSANHRDNLPEYANPLKYGVYPLGKSNKGSSPDLQGRLEIQVIPQDGTRNWARIKSALRRAETLCAKREGYHSLPFQIFVPFSTRSLKDTSKSLFPFTGIGRDRLASRGHDRNRLASSVVGTIMMVADLATIIFRLFGLVPRTVYQHYLQKNIPIKEMQFSTNSTRFDWGKGTVMICTYNKHNSGNDVLRPPVLVSPAFYLGG